MTENIELVEDVIEKDSIEKKVCLHCNKELEEEKSNAGANYNVSKFCNINCSRKYFANIKTQKLISSLDVKCCPNCNKELVPDENESYSSFKIRKFCNQSCSATYNNSRKPKKEYFCEFCNKKLKRKGKYCNGTCQQKYIYSKYIERWEQGLEDGVKGSYETSEYIRRYLYDKYENKCCKCGWNEVNPYTNKIPLEIEHIDGDYTNNKEENLELLCPNCHSLTATYKGANKGNGRKDRKKYSLYNKE